jgi:hypothetical protein
LHVFADFCYPAVTQILLKGRAQHAMAEQKRIGSREVRALGPNQEIWDGSVSGFGARRRSGATVSYVLMYRNAEGRLRRYTIGKHGSPWTPEMAREEAVRILGEVVRGSDPAADKQKPAQGRDRHRIM